MAKEELKNNQDQEDIIEIGLEKAYEEQREKKSEDINFEFVLGFTEELEKKWENNVFKNEEYSEEMLKE